MATVAYPHELDVKSLVEGSLGLQCDIELGARARAEFGNTVGNPKAEIEIEFLVPFHNVCVIGEHTSLKNRQAVKDHLNKLANKIDFLNSPPAQDRFTPFRIPDRQRDAYAAIERLRGCL